MPNILHFKNLYFFLTLKFKHILTLKISLFLLIFFILVEQVDIKQS